jgi:cytochrome c peroxidase
MALFYGPAGCSDCHSGPFQTDHDFHVMGLVQFGPGKRGRFEEHVRDEGRYRVTGDPNDLFAFRTPSLRMVAETAPYGHTGAYPDLESFLEAHTAPRAAWRRYDPDLAQIPSIEGDDAFASFADPAMAEAVLAAVAVPDRPLGPEEIAQLMAFLVALSDEGALAGRLGVPKSVPSGLPVER